ncbi:hypothetical protein [Marinomonas fungiae]|uniref:hypothetical protein n=1 Tax=Marinomonas fungiae TaxID=1137284 RepID=UPI00138F52FA|nr:hypothetical protein [Marinomonas fungiae]
MKKHAESDDSVFLEHCVANMLLCIFRESVAIIETPSSAYAIMSEEANKGVKEDE